MGEFWVIDCDNCGKTIRVTRNLDGKFISYEQDGSTLHDCSGKATAPAGGHSPASGPRRSSSRKSSNVFLLLMMLILGLLVAYWYYKSS